MNKKLQDFKNKHPNYEVVNFKNNYSKFYFYDENKILHKKVNLYLIKIFNNEELFFKIGLTSRTIKRRFNELSKYGYQYSIIDSFLIRGEEAYDKEKELQNLCKEYNYKPKTSYPGYTESFNKEIITIYEQFKNKYF